VNRSAALNHSSKPQFEARTQNSSALAITATPAAFSFYEEFYPVKSSRQEQPKTGVLHWVGSIIKKGREKIAFLSPQKFF
jgi:hypothetical protein